MRLKRPRQGDGYYRALLHACGEGLAVVDHSGVVSDETAPLRRMLGTSLVGRPLASVLHPEDGDRARSDWVAAAERAGTPPTSRWRLRRPDGSVIHAEVTLHNLLADPEVRGMVVNVRDTSHTRMLMQRLKHDAFRDALTGLPNRVAMLDRARIALARCDADKAVAVLFLDLDDFKTVNDSLGHAAGDDLLMATSDRLRDCLRPQDAPARLGGDEFAVLLEGLHSAEEAAEVANRIIEAFRDPFVVNASHIRVQTSIGVALAGPGTEGAEEMLRDADVAMYVAKERGKGRYEFFDEQMRAGAVARLQLRDALQGAIERGDFILHYQPVVDLRSGEVTGAEALLRWRDRSRGLVAPGRFVDLAEETGLMDTIGRWVLRRACQQARRWQVVTNRPLRVNVNLSARQLDQPGLAAEVAEVLSDTELEPGTLVVEITEQIFMQDSDRVLVNLQELKEIGVRLAIDDFGTGYSSLSYLQRFPVDYLKIDKSFVDEIGAGGSKPALTRAVIEIAHSLDLDVVAEGVERDDQLRPLQAMGCDLAQGFLFAKPLDVAGMARFLGTQRVPGVAAVPAEAAAQALRVAS
jgi:diguanylate cyclase (GGDEF)-like protein/PAS domain S-box-containing protein